MKDRSLEIALILFGLGFWLLAGFVYDATGWVATAGALLGVGIVFLLCALYHRIENSV